MSKLMPENVDCFNFQYNNCTQKKCPFQHRECARKSKVICTTWRLQKHCRNKQCINKHLDKTAMKHFFHCPREKIAPCNDVRCKRFHEIPGSAIHNGVRICRIASQVPVKEKSLPQKKKYIKYDIRNRMTLVRSSKVFIEVTLEFIKFNTRNGKLSKEKANCYIKQILHSVFFLGCINGLPICPEDVLRKDLYSVLIQRFPSVFRTYRTLLPTRTPYSILLDVVVETTEPSESPGYQLEYAVLDKLLELNKQMYLPPDQNDGKTRGNDFSLAATVVSYCYFSDFVTYKETKKYFGTSMSCKGRTQSEIFIDLSCIHTWNKNVALAVCLAANGNQSVLLPQFVRSAAFHMLGNKSSQDSKNPPREFEEQLTLDESGQNAFSNSSEHNNTTEGAMSFPQLPSQSSDAEMKAFQYVPKPPCERCLELFPNMQFSPEPNVLACRPFWEHGNCSECEALSKLLNAEISISMRVAIPTTFTILLGPEPLVFSQNAFPHDLLILPRRQRLANNLHKVRFELGEQFQFYYPMHDNESTALVPFQVPL